MWVFKSTDILQHKTNDLFYGFEFICACINEFLVLTKINWIDHVQKLKWTLNKLKEKGLKFNIEKYFFFRTEMGYLGFWVTCDGVKPINKKVNASNENMKQPTYQKELCQFIGVVNHYHNMWERNAHMLATLIKILSSKVKFKWNKIEQDASDEIKRIVASDTLLAYTDFYKEFKINSDARNFQ